MPVSILFHHEKVVCFQCLLKSMKKKSMVTYFESTVCMCTETDITEVEDVSDFGSEPDIPLSARGGGHQVSSPQGGKRSPLNKSPSASPMSHSFAHLCYGDHPYPGILVLALRCCYDQSLDH